MSEARGGQPVRRRGALLAGWFALTFLLESSSRPGAPAALAAALWTFVVWLAFGLTRRFPLARGSWARGLAVYAAAGLLLVLLRRAATLASVRWLGAPPPTAHAHHLASLLFLFVLLLGVAHAVEYARWYREKELAGLRLRATLAETDLERTRTELRALKMELNPHFLFNSLHAISLLMREDVATAGRMLRHLAELLRRGLETVGMQEVTLEEELAFLRPFLEIEQARFGERLRVEWRIEEQTLGARVPHLALQPLVENAIKHGISGSPRPGVVTVAARRAGEDLVLEVEDNGAGLDPARAAAGGKVGLANVRDRLQGLYGDAAELTLEPAPEHGTVARVRIPPGGARRSAIAEPVPPPLPPLPVPPGGGRVGRPPRWRGLRRPALGAWFVVNAAFGFFAWRGAPTGDGGVVSDAGALLLGGVDAAVLTAFLFAAVRLTRRYPLRGEQWRPHLRRYAAAALGLAAVGWAARFGLTSLVGSRAGEGPLASALGVIPALVVLFALLVGVVHAVEFAGWYQQKEADELRLRSSLAEAELERKRAELRALKMELNPHFLFNSLHAISTLMARDVDLAQGMLQRLSDLLRRSLDHAASLEVTLEEELAFLRPFLEIEQARLGERLRVEWRIEEQTLDVPVPHLVLQPLVENAIRHGVGPLAGGATVRVSAGVEGDHLRLEVRDTGVGVKEADLFRPGAGLGLNNVRARLRQLYGGEARLEVLPAAGGGTVARLRIPLDLPVPASSEPTPLARAGTR